MSVTTQIIDDVLSRLKDRFGNELEIDYYPEDPTNYRLNHPVGAVLLGFASASFGSAQALDDTFMERSLTLPLTFVFNKLNGADGVIYWLDAIRGALTGKCVCHCDRPLQPVEERFVSNVDGLWQYAQSWSTRTIEVQGDDVNMDNPFDSPIFNLS